MQHTTKLESSINRIVYWLLMAVTVCVLGSFRAWADDDDTVAYINITGPGSFSGERNYDDGNHFGDGDNLYLWAPDGLPEFAKNWDYHFYIVNKAGNGACDTSNGLGSVTTEKQVNVWGACGGSAYGYAARSTMTLTATKNTTSDDQKGQFRLRTRIGNNEDDWLVTYNIPGKKTCSLTLNKSSVDLGTFYTQDLAAVTAGTDMPGHTATVVTTASCNQSAYTLTLKPGSVGGSCIGTTNGALRYCVDVEGTRLDMSSGSATNSGAGADNAGGSETTLTFTAQKGSSTPVTGVSSGSVTITVAPE